MALQIQTDIQIQAAPEKVWQALMDFTSYPLWNSFIKKIEGTAVKGSTLSVEITNMKFTPKVLNVEQSKHFRWLGKLWFKGLFDGEHYFILEKQEDGTTKFIHGENFSGILVAVFKSKLLNDTKAGFETMNQELKKRVEEQIS